MTKATGMTGKPLSDTRFSRTEDAGTGRSNKYFSGDFTAQELRTEVAEQKDPLEQTRMDDQSGFDPQGAPVERPDPQGKLAASRRPATPAESPSIFRRLRRDIGGFVAYLFSWYRY